jgi:aspartyl-tRNA(Asn)/glutamyl-tRNA(Gln) amidotransferase subunit A
MNDLLSMASALRTRRVSALELVEESLRRIEEYDPALNAFISITAEEAREFASTLDAELAQGVDRGVLHGIPIAYKDLIKTRGIPTTAGSKLFADYIPQRDAEIVTLIEEAGGISMGKTGLHELAYGITSNNLHYGAIRNPWDPERVPGGSSGGSAVAVATGMVPFAVGTDTGGSIRVPASFCGVVGLKPTFGKISVKGVLPLGWTQDHIGPMAMTVRDAALGYHSMLVNSSGYLPPAGVDLNGIRIGWPQNFFFDRVDPEIWAAVRGALQTAASIDGQVIAVQVPEMEEARQAGATCLLAEASTVYRKYLKQPDWFSAEVFANLQKGSAISAMDYVDAMRARKRISAKFAKLFEQVDCVFTPATPITAPLIGQKEVEVGGELEEVRAAATRFTRPFNALGFPAISIPCGLSSAGLPMGLQIVANKNHEDLLLRIAAAMEDAMGLAGERPSL